MLHLSISLAFLACLCQAKPSHSYNSTNGVVIPLNSRSSADSLFALKAAEASALNRGDFDGYSDGELINFTSSDHPDLSAPVVLSRIWSGDELLVEVASLSGSVDIIRIPDTRPSSRRRATTRRRTAKTLAGIAAPPLIRPVNSGSEGKIVLWCPRNGFDPELDEIRFLIEVTYYAFTDANGKLVDSDGVTACPDGCKRTHKVLCTRTGANAYTPSLEQALADDETISLFPGGVIFSFAPDQVGRVTVSNKDSSGSFGTGMYLAGPGCSRDPAQCDYTPPLGIRYDIDLVKSEVMFVCGKFRGFAYSYRGVLSVGGSNFDFTCTRKKTTGPPEFETNMYKVVIDSPNAALIDAGDADSGRFVIKPHMSSSPVSVSANSADVGLSVSAYLVRRTGTADMHRIVIDNPIVGCFYAASAAYTVALEDSASTPYNVVCKSGGGVDSTTVLGFKADEFVALPLGDPLTVTTGYTVDSVVVVTDRILHDGYVFDSIAQSDFDTGAIIACKDTSPADPNDPFPDAPGVFAFELVPTDTILCTRDLETNMFSDVLHASYTGANTKFKPYGRGVVLETGHLVTGVSTANREPIVGDDTSGCTIGNVGCEAFRLIAARTPHGVACEPYAPIDSTVTFTINDMGATKQSSYTCTYVGARPAVLTLEAGGTLDKAYLGGNEVGYGGTSTGTLQITVPGTSFGELMGGSSNPAAFQSTGARIVSGAHSPSDFIRVTVKPQPVVFSCVNTPLPVTLKFAVGGDSSTLTCGGSDAFIITQTTSLLRVYANSKFALNVDPAAAFSITSYDPRVDITGITCDSGSSLLTTCDHLGFADGGEYAVEYKADVVKCLQGYGGNYQMTLNIGGSNVALNCADSYPVSVVGGTDLVVLSGTGLTFSQTALGMMVSFSGPLSLASEYDTSASPCVAYPCTFTVATGTARSIALTLASSVYAEIKCVSFSTDAEYASASVVTGGVRRSLATWSCSGDAEGAAVQDSGNTGKLMLVGKNIEYETSGKGVVFQNSAGHAAFFDACKDKSACMVKDPFEAFNVELQSLPSQVVCPGSGMVVFTIKDDSDVDQQLTCSGGTATDPTLPFVTVATDRFLIKFQRPSLIVVGPTAMIGAALSGTETYSDEFISSCLGESSCTDASAFRNPFNVQLYEYSTPSLTAVAKCATSSWAVARKVEVKIGAWTGSIVCTGSTASIDGMNPPTTLAMTAMDTVTYTDDDATPDVVSFQAVSPGVRLSVTSPSPASWATSDSLIDAFGSASIAFDITVTDRVIVCGEGLPYHATVTLDSNSARIRCGGAYGESTITNSPSWLSVVKSGGKVWFVVDDVAASGSSVSVVPDASEGVSVAEHADFISNPATCTDNAGTLTCSGPFILQLTVADAPRIRCARRVPYPYTYTVITTVPASTTTTVTCKAWGGGTIIEPAGNGVMAVDGATTDVFVRGDRASTTVSLSGFARMVGGESSCTSASCSLANVGEDLYIIPENTLECSTPTALKIFSKDGPLQQDTVLNCATGVATPTVSYLTRDSGTPERYFINTNLMTSLKLGECGANYLFTAMNSITSLAKCTGATLCEPSLDGPINLKSDPSATATITCPADAVSFTLGAVVGSTSGTLTCAAPATCDGVFGADCTVSGNVIKFSTALATLTSQSPMVTLEDKGCTTAACNTEGSLCNAPTLVTAKVQKARIVCGTAPAGLDGKYRFTLAASSMGTSKGAVDIECGSGVAPTFVAPATGDLSGKVKASTDAADPYVDISPMLGALDLTLTAVAGPVTFRATSGASACIGASTCVFASQTAFSIVATVQARRIACSATGVFIFAADFETASVSSDTLTCTDGVLTQSGSALNIVNGVGHVKANVRMVKLNPVVGATGQHIRLVVRSGPTSCNGAASCEMANNDAFDIVVEPLDARVSCAPADDGTSETFLVSLLEDNAGTWTSICDVDVSCKGFDAPMATPRTTPACTDALASAQAGDATKGTLASVKLLPTLSTGLRLSVTAAALGVRVVNLLPTQATCSADATACTVDFGGAVHLSVGEDLVTGTTRIECGHADADKTEYTYEYEVTMGSTSVVVVCTDELNTAPTLAVTNPVQMMPAWLTFSAGTSAPGYAVVATSVGATVRVDGKGGAGVVVSRAGSTCVNAPSCTSTGSKSAMYTVSLLPFGVKCGGSVLGGHYEPFSATLSLPTSTTPLKVECSASNGLVLTDGTPSLGKANLAETTVWLNPAVVNNAVVTIASTIGVSAVSSLSSVPLSSIGWGARGVDVVLSVTPRVIECSTGAFEEYKISVTRDGVTPAGEITCAAMTGAASTTTGWLGVEAGTRYVHLKSDVTEELTLTSTTPRVYFLRTDGALPSCDGLTPCVVGATDVARIVAVAPGEIRSVFACGGDATSVYPHTFKVTYDVMEATVTCPAGGGPATVTAGLEAWITVSGRAATVAGTAVGGSIKVDALTTERVTLVAPGNAACDGLKTCTFALTSSSMMRVDLARVRFDCGATTNPFSFKVGDSTVTCAASGASVVAGTNVPATAVAGYVELAPTVVADVTLATVGGVRHSVCASAGSCMKSVTGGFVSSVTYIPSQVTCGAMSGVEFGYRVYFESGTNKRVWVCKNAVFTEDTTLASGTLDVYESTSVIELDQPAQLAAMDPLVVRVDPGATHVLGAAVAGGEQAGIDCAGKTTCMITATTAGYVRLAPTYQPSLLKCSTVNAKFAYLVKVTPNPGAAEDVKCKAGATGAEVPSTSTVLKVRTDGLVEIAPWALASVSLAGSPGVTLTMTSAARHRGADAAAYVAGSSHLCAGKATCTVTADYPFALTVDYVPTLVRCGALPTGVTSYTFNVGTGSVQCAGSTLTATPTGGILVATSDAAVVEVDVATLGTGTTVSLSVVGTGLTFSRFSNGQRELGAAAACAGTSTCTVPLTSPFAVEVLAADSRIKCGSSSAVHDYSYTITSMLDSTSKCTVTCPKAGAVVSSSNIACAVIAASAEVVVPPSWGEVQLAGGNAARWSAVIRKSAGTTNNAGDVACAGSASCTLAAGAAYSVTATSTESILRCSDEAHAFDFTITADVGTSTDAVITCKKENGGAQVTTLAWASVHPTDTRAVVFAPGALASGVELKGHSGIEFKHGESSVYTDADVECNGKNTCDFVPLGGFDLLAFYTPSRIFCDMESSNFAHSFVLKFASVVVSSDEVEVTCGPHSEGIVVSGDNDAARANSGGRSVELSPKALLHAPFTFTGRGGFHFSPHGAGAGSASACVGKHSCMFPWTAPFEMMVNTAASLVSCGSETPPLNFDYEFKIRHGDGTTLATVKCLADGAGVTVTNGASWTVADNTARTVDISPAAFAMGSVVLEGAPSVTWGVVRRHNEHGSDADESCVGMTSCTLAPGLAFSVTAKGSAATGTGFIRCLPLPMGTTARVFPYVHTITRKDMPTAVVSVTCPADPTAAAVVSPTVPWVTGRSNGVAEIGAAAVVAGLNLSGDPGVTFIPAAGAKWDSAAEACAGEGKCTIPADPARTTLDLLVGHDLSYVKCGGSDGPFGFSFDVLADGTASWKATVTCTAAAGGAGVMVVTGDAGSAVVAASGDRVYFNTRAFLGARITIDGGHGVKFSTPAGLDDNINTPCAGEQVCAFDWTSAFAVTASGVTSRIACDHGGSVFDFSYTVTFAGTTAPATIKCGATTISTTAPSTVVQVDTATRSAALSPAALAAGPVVLKGTHMSFVGLSRRNGKPVAGDSACGAQRDCTVAAGYAFTATAQYTPTTLRCDTQATDSHSILVVLEAGSAAAKAVEIACTAQATEVKIHPAAAAAGATTPTAQPTWVKVSGTSAVEFEPAAGLDKVLLLAAQGGASFNSVDRRISADVAVCAQEAACVFKWTSQWSLGIKVSSPLRSVVLNDVSALGPLGAASIQTLVGDAKSAITFTSSSACAAVDREHSGQLVSGADVGSACVTLTSGTYRAALTAKGCKAEAAGRLTTTDTEMAKCGTADGVSGGTCTASGAGRIQYVRWTKNDMVCDIIKSVDSVDQLLTGIPSINSTAASDGSGGISTGVIELIQNALQAVEDGDAPREEVLSRIAELGYGVHSSGQCVPCTPTVTSTRVLVCLPCSTSRAEAAASLRQAVGNPVLFCPQSSADGQRDCWAKAACDGVVDGGRPFGCSVMGKWEACPFCAADVGTPASTDSESVTSFGVIWIVLASVTVALLILAVVLVALGVACGVRRGAPAHDVNRIKFPPMTVDTTHGAGTVGALPVPLVDYGEDTNGPRSGAYHADYLE